MKLHRIRARLLFAMGLPASCAPTEPAAAPRPETSAPVPAPIANEPVPPEVAADAAAPAEDAAPVATPQPDASTTAPQPPAAPPEPKTAWRVSYKLPPGTEKWCTHGSARCQPAADTVAAPSAGKGKLGCAGAIEVQCPCSPAGCDELGPCVAALHTQLSLRERAKDKTACCYDLPRQCVPPFVGRPLRCDGEIWFEPAELGEDASARTRQWATIAALEHASVASFARVALQLLALGAPPALVRATFEAALDEIEHAELARGVAELDREPGPLPAALLHVEPTELASFAAATFRDGCIEETLGAIVAQELADSEPEPGLRAVLARIAEDETRHAELAWRTLAWAIREGGQSVLERVRSELAAAAAAAAAATGDARRRELLSELVTPCLDALQASLNTAMVSGRCPAATRSLASTS